MTVTVEWFDNEKTILYMRFSETWTWDEVYDAVGESKNMIDSVSIVVGVIDDFSLSSSLPASAMLHARRLTSMQHPRSGLTVFVGMTSVFKTVWDVFKKLPGTKAYIQQFTFTDTIDEAVERLSYWRKNLYQAQVDYDSPQDNEEQA